MDFVNENIVPITFGIEEQMITCGAVLSGFTLYPKKKIIIALIIMALSNSLPDTLSYYDEKIGGGVEESKAIELSSVVFGSEIISTVIILLPFIFIKDKNKAILCCYLLITAILISANYLTSRNLVSSLFKLPIYAAICLFIWYISKVASERFDISV